MKTCLALAALCLGACSPASYYYSFDLSDPGARNLTKPGQRDTWEDGDVKVEVLVDPTTFQAVAFDVTNKTDRALEVQWPSIVMLAPDGTQMPLRPDQQLGFIDPGQKLAARLIPFSLPPTGGAAAAYDGTKFELDVPMVVRGAPKLYQFHMLVHMQKL